MQQTTTTGAREKSGNIDQIRELMFGAQIREFDGRFETLESELATSHEEMHKRINEVNSALSGELHAAVESLEKQIKSLDFSGQEDRTDLRQQIERTDSKFTNRFQSLSEAVDANATSLREELSQATGKLQGDVQDLKTQVFDELNKRFSMLGEVKVSKDDMAEILFEVGLRIKGAELVPDLEETDIPETTSNIEQSEHRDSKSVKDNTLKAKNEKA